MRDCFKEDTEAIGNDRRLLLQLTRIVMMLITIPTSGYSGNPGKNPDRAAEPQSESHSPHASLATLLPKGIEGIHLGMTREALLRSRPDLEADYTPIASSEPVAVTQYSEEVSDNPFFSVVSYELSDHNLQRITLGGAWPLEIIAARRDKFLAWVESVLGSPEETAVRLLQRRSAFHVPVFLWRKETFHCAVSYSPSQDLQGQSYDQSSEPFAPYFFEVILVDDEGDPLSHMSLLLKSESTDQHLFSDWVAMGGQIPSVRRN